MSTVKFREVETLKKIGKMWKNMQEIKRHDLLNYKDTLIALRSHESKILFVGIYTELEPFRYSLVMSNGITARSFGPINENDKAYLVENRTDIYPDS